MNGEEKMSVYDEICRELTIFENNEDKEMTESDWNDVFYSLLVKVQNAIDLGTDMKADGEER